MHRERETAVKRRVFMGNLWFYVTNVSPCCQPLSSCIRDSGPTIDFFCAGDAGQVLTPVVPGIIPITVVTEEASSSWKPRKHQTLSHCWLNVGRASQTVARH